MIFLLPFLATTGGGTALALLIGKAVEASIARAERRAGRDALQTLGCSDHGP